MGDYFMKEIKWKRLMTITLTYKIEERSWIRDQSSYKQLILWGLIKIYIHNSIIRSLFWNSVTPTIEHLMIEISILNSDSTCLMHFVCLKSKVLPSLLQNTFQKVYLYPNGGWPTTRQTHALTPLIPSTPSSYEA